MGSAFVVRLSGIRVQKDSGKEEYNQIFEFGEEKHLHVGSSGNEECTL